MSGRTDGSLSDAQAIYAVTTAMGSLADRRDWAGLRQLFDDQVDADYTALLGGEPAVTSPDRLVAGWRESLGKYYVTQHMLTNHAARVAEDEADAVTYFQATHCKPDGTLWILGGRYDYRLRRTGDGWRICALTMTPVWSRDEPNCLAAATCSSG